MEKYEIEEIKSNLQSYLELNGIDTRRNFRCLNPTHLDDDPSMRYYDDHKVWCFGCGAQYDLIDVISIIENVDNKEAFKRACKNYYRPNYTPKEKTKREKIKKDYSNAYEFWKDKLEKSAEAKEYLLARGIDLETAKRFNIGFNTFNFGKYKFNSIVIPNCKNCFTARNLDKENTSFRYYKPKNSTSDIFNKSALTNDIAYCVITEGEFDCLSFETLGINAIALCSANNINKFIEQEKDMSKTYILALDNDEAGYKNSQSLISYFRDNEIKYKEFDNCEYKDANKALTSDRNYFEESINKLILSLQKKQEMEM